MYQAIVVACMMSNMEICVTFEGQQWFDIERTCKVRALGMASDVHKYYKGYKPVSYRCRALPKGQLSR
tara:strand:+ start:680 stop:883 length:204 start_codon:yes stop_codon:yes gene_type:complete